jgi:hypothetical protein
MEKALFMSRKPHLLLEKNYLTFGKRYYIVLIVRGLAQAKIYLKCRMAEMEDTCKILHLRPH